MAKKKDPIAVRAHKRKRGRLPPRDEKGRFRKRRKPASKKTQAPSIQQQLSLLIR